METEALKTAESNPSATPKPNPTDSEDLNSRLASRLLFSPQSVGVCDGESYPEVPLFVLSAQGFDFDSMAREIDAPLVPPYKHPRLNKRAPAILRGIYLVSI